MKGNVMRYVPQCLFIISLCVLIGMCSHHQHKEEMARIQIKAQQGK